MPRSLHRTLGRTFHQGLLPGTCFHPRIPIRKGQKGTDHEEHEHHGEAGRQCKHMRARRWTTSQGTRQWLCERRRCTVTSATASGSSQGRHIPYLDRIASRPCRPEVSRQISNLDDSHEIACQDLVALVLACVVMSTTSTYLWICNFGQPALA